MGLQHSKESLKSVFSDPELGQLRLECQQLVEKVVARYKVDPKQQQTCLELEQQCLDEFFRMAQAGCLPKTIPDAKSLLTVLCQTDFFTNLFPKVASQSLRESGMADSKAAEEKLVQIIQVLCGKPKFQEYVADQLFSVLDSNDDGQVSALEFATALAAWHASFESEFNGGEPTAMAQWEFENLDVDKSGFVEFAETKRLVVRDLQFFLRMSLLRLLAYNAIDLCLSPCGSERSRGRTQRYLNKARGLVQLFDQRRVRIDEIFFEHDAEIRQHWFAQADTNQDGRLTFEEFAATRKYGFLNELSRWVFKTYCGDTDAAWVVSVASQTMKLVLST